MPGFRRNLGMMPQAHLGLRSDLHLIPAGLKGLELNRTYLHPEISAVVTEGMAGEDELSLKGRLELAVFSLEMSVGFRKVGDLHLLGVPLKAFARELAGDHPETEGFSQGARIVEPSQGFVLALDGVEELGIMIHPLDIGLVDVLQD